MSAKLPLIGDPKNRGPIDIVVEWCDRAERFAEENSTILIPTVAVLFLGTVGLVLHYDVPAPSMPNWGWVALIATIIATPYAWILGKQLATGLYVSSVEVLSIQNPVSGDQKLIKVDPDRFREITVVTHNGKRRDTDFLHTVRINGVRCFEIDDYHEGRNIAVASWMAGESNSSIRAEKRQIKRIKTDLEHEADKAMELLANYPEILRKHATEVANRLVKASVGIEIPNGSKLHERLNETIEEADPSEDLLSGPDDTDDSDGSSPSSEDEETPQDADSEIAGDIFERAAAMAQNDSQEAVSDD